MRKHLIATAAFAFTTALSMSAGAFFSPNSAKSNDAKTLSFHPRDAKTLYAPKALDNNGIMTPDTVHTATYSKAQNGLGYFISPEGKEWFYTLECDGRVIQYDYFGMPEYDYEKFHLTIFDENTNVVGHVKGKVTRPEDAIKCQSIVPGLQLSRAFFNTNTSNLEVMMTSNFNPGPDEEGKPRYGAKQFTDVYAFVPGEAEPEEYSESIFHCDGYYIEAIQPENSVTENFVMAFAFESTWDKEDTSQISFKLYKKTGYGDKAPTVIADSKIDKDLIYGGTGENATIPFTVKLRGNDIFFATAALEKTFVDEPGSTTQREENNYVIKLHKVVNNGIQLAYETKIKCTKAGDGFTWREYALGNFSGADDITYDFGNGTDPCYIITIVDSNVQEESTGYYVVYDHKGNEVTRFGEGSDGFVRMSDIKGTATQYGFARETEEGYGLELVEFPSLKKIGFLPQLFEYEGDAWTRGGAPDRVPAAGGNLYAVEVGPVSGSSEKVDTYIGYLNPDGTMHHIDKLYFGEKTAKAIPFIASMVLDPYLFTTDKNQEYLVWLYTYKNDGSTGTDLSLVVCNATGGVIAKREMPSGHTYETAYVSNVSTEPYIVASYRNIIAGNPQGSPRTNEFIKLPLNKFEGEGTVENPYLLKTFGDLDQVRNNLTSHFALANTIDCENRSFRPVAGTFTGSIDGKGFALNNFNLKLSNTGEAMFKELGMNQPGTAQENLIKASIKNLTINTPALSFEGGNLGTKNLALLANEVYNTDIANVHILNPTFAIKANRITFGTFANKASHLSLADCSVKNADIDIALAPGIGGFVYDLRNSSVTNCSFSGKLSGRQNIGGFAAITGEEASAFANNHVNAEITATISNAGGLVASNSSRSTAFNNIVEGTLTCDENVGAIFGELPSSTLENEDNIVENNVIALTAFNVGDKPECAHRVIGKSAIDEGTHYITVPNPDWDPNGPGDEETNPSTIQKEVEATADTTIGNNYVVTAIDAVETPTDGTSLATEGTDFAAADSDKAWYETIGFKFGTNAAAPWVATATVPALYFEATVDQQLYFENDAINGNVGETVTATLIMVNVEPGEPSFSFSTAGIAEVANIVPDETDSSKAIVTIDLLEGGSTSLSLTMGGKTAVLHLTVLDKSGVDNVATESTALTYSNGILSAASCQIAVFDAQGRLAAQGFETVSTDALAAGLYIARANGADGFSATLKFVVK